MAKNKKKKAPNNKFKDFIQRYNIKNLKNEIHQYGFDYSTKDFVVQVLLILGVTFGVSYVSLLHVEYMSFLMAIALILTPFLIWSWFGQLYSTKRFTMLTDYLSNIIPIFMQKAKVRFALGEVKNLCSGVMKDKVQEAIDYMDNNTTDVDALKTALSIIEDEFPNSRLKSVHKMMMTVENESSISYQDVCENMFVDIENWVKRVYTFQKDLHDRRNKLLMLCGITLAMNCLFVFLYNSNIYFDGFADRTLYQVSTTIFIAAILITAVVVVTKLHGGWLVNDLTDKDEERIAKAYDKLQLGKPKLKPVDAVMAAIIVILGGYLMVFKDQFGIGLVTMALAYALVTRKNNVYRSNYKLVNKALTLEFPVWLREVSLSLNNMTVLNAIEKSMEMTSYPFTKELEKFMAVVQEDPTSIKAFAEFLQDFDLPDAQSSMRVLYSIQNLGRKETKEQVASLILRNQEMLDKAETIRNEDSISGIEAMGYLPIVIFSVQMMVSLVILFGHMMDKMNEAMAGAKIGEM